MVGHDAPNALTQAARALIDEIAQRQYGRSEDDTEMDRRLLDRFIGETAKMRQDIARLERLRDELQAELDRLRESREG